MTTPIPDPKLEAFYHLNPDFDLKTFNFNDTTVNALNWQGLNEAENIERLKAYQNLLELTPDPAIAQKLSDRGYTSARQIAAIPEAQFLETVTPDIPTDDAQKIYAQATEAAPQDEPETTPEPVEATAPAPPPVLQIPDPALKAFYHLNPHFDLQTFDFSDTDAVSALDWEGLDETENIERLKAYQRLLAIAPDPTVAEQLIDRGYTSANQIAASPEHRFLKAMEGAIDASTATQIYQTAAHIRAQTLHLFANVNTIAASPHFIAMRPNNTAELAGYFQNFSGFSDLFRGIT